jgi:hypothetical protein
MRDFIIACSHPAFSWEWDGFSFWDFFRVHLLLRRNPQMDHSIDDVPSRPDCAAPDGRKFQIMLMGSRDDILEAIRTLHRLNYAEAGGWSPVVPVLNSTQMVSVLTRWRAVKPKKPE